MKTYSENTDRWWGREGGDLPNPYYAAKIFRSAAPIEKFILEGRGPLDCEVQDHQRKHRMGKNDRALLGMGVYGLARSLKPLRAAAGEGLPPGTLLALGYLDQIEEEKRPYGSFAGFDYRGAIERAAEIRNWWLSLVSGDPKSPLPSLSDEARVGLASYLSIPPFWLDIGPWRTAGEALSELSAGRKRQSLQLRANTLKTSREELKDLLMASGITSEFTKYSSVGLKISGTSNVKNLPSFRGGYFEVQDEGSQLIALACGAKPGMKVLDLCAGSGGKSLALASSMGDEGFIAAHDTSKQRLSRSSERIERSGASIIKVIYDFKEVAGNGPYDVVLVDAPCSSTGTLRRNPDVAWRWDGDAILAMGELQSSILRKGSSLVKSGGKLVYSTCSLLAPENGLVAVKFLAASGDFSKSAVPLDLPRSVYGDEGVRLPLDLPGYEGDGYFIAAFVKK